MNILILPAAGSGQRLGLNQPKALIKLKHQPTSIVERTAAVFAESGVIDGIIIAAPASHIHEFRQLKFPSGTYIIEGGETRQQSVSYGVKALDELFPQAEIILVHDAARCFLTTDLVCRCVEAAKEYKAVTCGIRITDTIAKTGLDDQINSYVPRDSLWSIQTPQCFTKQLIQQAHTDAPPDATDDTTLVSRFHPVRIIEGEKNNIKVTYPSDLDLTLP